MAIRVKTGELTIVSGIYRCVRCKQEGRVQEITLAKGDKVPPCRECKGTEFILVRETRH